MRKNRETGEDDQCEVSRVWEEEYISDASE